MKSALDACDVCGGQVAKKAVMCPHCGLLLRPNYVVVLVTTGVWFTGVTFGLLYLLTAMATGL